MFLRSSAGVFTALLLLMAATVCSCSDKTFRDINYGTDVGSGFIPEVLEVQADRSDGAADGGDSGGDAAADADASDPLDGSTEAIEAAGDDAETLDNS